MKNEKYKKIFFGGCNKDLNSNGGVLIWNDKGRNPQNNVYR